MTDIAMGGNLGDEIVIIEGDLTKLAEMKSLESVFLGFGQLGNAESVQPRKTNSRQSPCPDKIG